MRTWIGRWVAVGQLVLVGLSSACGSTGHATTAAADTAGYGDALAASDGVASDTQTGPDAPQTSDTTTTDAAAGDKTTPWGPISGACGNLAGEWTSSKPSFLVNTWKFNNPGPFDPKPLRSGAQARYSGPNAGGSSKCSEVMSMQLLYECEGATTLKTEVEIQYSQAGAITDWLALVAGHKIGVSVTRAYKGPTIQTYTESDATALLTKKLTGVLESTANVAAADKWQKQVVHIWTLHADWVPVLQAAWQKLDDATKSDTIVLVTVEAGSTDVTADTCQ